MASIKKHAKVLLEKEPSIFLWVMEIQLPEYAMLLRKDVSLSIQNGYSIIFICRLIIY